MTSSAEKMIHMGLLALRLGATRDENAEIVSQIYLAMQALDPKIERLRNDFNDALSLLSFHGIPFQEFPSLTSDEEAELVARINDNPLLKPEPQSHSPWADPRFAYAYLSLDAIAETLVGGSTEKGCIHEAMSKIELADKYVEQRQKDNAA